VRHQPVNLVRGLVTPQRSRNWSLRRSRQTEQAGLRLRAMRSARVLGEHPMTRRESSGAGDTRSVRRQRHRRQHADGHEQRQKKATVRDW
jgi:hypothetical protein